MIGKTLCRSLIAATLVMLAFGSPASAQPSVDGTGSQPGPFGQMMQGLNPANWRMPEFKLPKMSNFLPTPKEKKRVIEKKDGFVDEVSKTAKNSWRRTKETLNPMRLMPAGFKQNRQTQPAPKKQGGFFSGLFGPRESPQKSSTPSEFLKQDPVR